MATLALVGSEKPVYGALEVVPKVRVELTRGLIPNGF